MSLTIKAYLTRLDQQLQPEIRRFGVDADVSTNYNYFVSKINSIFPGLANKTYTLGWRDAENDLILFSSDEELTEALGYVNDGVFKIYITEKAESSGATPGRQRFPRVHRGVVCDGCQGQVVGIRYKCDVCPDFDLCEVCKGNGLHPEHSMTAIEKPRCHWKQFGFGSGPDFQFHRPPFPGPPGYPGAPDFCAPAPPAPGNAPTDAPFVPPGPLPDFSGMDRRMMMKIQRRAWRRWFRETYGEQMKKCKKRAKDAEKKKEKKDKKKKKMEKMAGEAANGGAGVDAEKKDVESSSSSSGSSSSEDEEARSPTEDYLKKVGHCVVGMLDPLGIDVEVDVEHQGSRRRCHKPWAGGGFWGMRGGHMGTPWGMGLRRGGCGWRGRGGWGAGPWCNQPAAPEQQPAAEKATTMEQEHSSEGPRADSAPTGSVSPPREQDWTFLQPSSSGTDVEGAARAVENLHVTGQTEIPSTSATSLAATSDTTPVVREAVEKMMSMGYTNEGDWLTALLTVYKGDINAALDAIKQQK